MIKFLKRIFRKKRPKLTQQELGYIKRDVAVTQDCVKLMINSKYGRFGNGDNLK